MLFLTEMLLNSKFNNFEFNNPEPAKDLLPKFNNFEFNNLNLIILNSMT
jgi:hypothetical protein